ncbi:MAG TPA: GNAT family N-acetyltransferase [Solirubrobacteraceae bacterium]|nr:GNAT family N-acetyltransferase [Solirubrobacteraceae bacterium]
MSDDAPIHIRFEPLDERWLRDVTELVTDPEVLRFTRVPEPAPDGFAHAWMARYDTGRLDGTREGFAAVSGEGRFLGLALAPHMDATAGEMELGYIVARAARGRGVASAILSKLTRWAFDERGAHRIYLIIDVQNAASERVAERCGYHREGVMRSIHVKQDRRADAGLWSRLRSDPDPPA